MVEFEAKLREQIKPYEKLEIIIMRFLAIKKYRDGGEQTIEYFKTREECLAWIQKQKQPTDDSWMWCVGEY
jgi:hypothetical protein